MKLDTVLFSTVLAAIQVVNGAPAAAPSNPPLRGSGSLQGYSASNVVSNENTDAIKYQLAPGQKDDAKIGAYLDFEKIDNPQPIRGTGGGLEPGPRGCCKMFCSCENNTMLIFYCRQLLLRPDQQ
jgi:hypothetical protein